MAIWKRLLALLAAFSFSISCSAVELAFFDVTSNGDVYLHTPKVLDPTDRITVLGDDQKDCCSTFSGRDFLKTGNSEQASSDDDGKAVIRYTLVSGKNNKLRLAPQTSATVIGDVKILSAGKNKFELTSSSKNYVVETCYGIEGRNLYLKRQGKLVQHLYYYFNVDIEPDCK